MPPSNSASTNISSVPSTTSTTASFNITELPPAIPAQFSVVQHYTQNAATPPVEETVQPNLLPLSDCNNINTVLTSMYPSSSSTTTVTFIQPLNSTTTPKPLNAPLYQVTNQHSIAATYQPPTTMPLRMSTSTATHLPLAAAATPPSQLWGTLPVGNTTMQLQNPQHTQPQQLLAAPTLLPQQLLAASTLPLIPAQLHQQIMQGG